VGVIWRVAKRELMQMGRFILAMALKRALEEGVIAETVILRGVLSDVLQQVVREMDVTTIFLEHPVGETCRFDEAELEKFPASSQTVRSE
jgi:hypothetical protein